VLAYCSSIKEIKMTEILAFLALYFGFGSAPTPISAVQPPEIFSTAARPAVRPPDILFSGQRSAAQPPDILISGARPAVQGPEILF
jgi:hypothetical protein